MELAHIPIHITFHGYMTNMTNWSNQDSTLLMYSAEVSSFNVVCRKSWHLASLKSPLFLVFPQCIMILSICHSSWRTWRCDERKVMSHKAALNLPLVNTRNHRCVSTFSAIINLVPLFGPAIGAKWFFGSEKFTSFVHKTHRTVRAVVTG